jgi:integrase
MLLLSGVSPEEAASLDWQDISFETGALNIKGDNQRQITLSDHTIEAFRRFSNNEKHQGSIWLDTNNSHMPIHDLEAMISCASFDAGLANADEINSNSLRHTYLAFLARQGIRLSEFQHICGPISPITLRHYGRYSPPGSGIALNENNSTYTALR